MLNCFSSIKFLLLFLIIVSLTGHTAEKKKIVYLTKEKLRCLQEQVEDLLDEKTDPLLVVFTRDCHRTSTQIVESEKMRVGIPEINPKVNAQDPTLKREDLLLITRSELQCFELQFGQLMKSKKEPIRIEFTESCTQDSKNRL